MARPATRNLTAHDMLVDDATYAVYYDHGGRDGWCQIGIVSGTTAQQMVKDSKSPEHLAFNRLA